MEKRNKVRIKTHSAAKLVSSIQLQRVYGYLDNLSEDGMGIITPDLITPGARFTCGFFLGDSTQKVNTVATMVHVQKGLNSVYYYGFRFDYISSDDRKTVSEYVNQEYKKEVRL
ncbi:MAG TPA: PilZ domain-containing protein [Bacillota bacterium]|nr:PilZ domain-containing protein [Bacillota bacterium]